jgi:peptidoglycan/LPS O-acetylase OafA/YrhL
VSAVASPPRAEASAQPQLAAARPRLDHVDAIRPVKQLGVVATHSFLFFAPGASVFNGASVMLLHVSREAFLFVSACMLTYAYGDVKRINYRRFYARRAVSVALPYACWTVIYWALELRWPITSWSAQAEHLSYLFGTGYYQLYYLVVIAEFYALFPLVLLLLRATRRHPIRLLAVSAVVQLVLTGLIHWHALPSLLEGSWATREVTSYQFYLIAGCVAATHFSEFNAWIVAHAKVVLAGTLLGAIIAEGWFALAWYHVFGWMGAATDVFQPAVLPFNVGAICCLYLLGRFLVDSRRSARVRLWARRGADSAYGVFLSQMLVITILVDIGWGNLDQSIPWPVVVVLTALVVFAVGGAASLVINRTPLSRALTGQPRQRGQRKPLPGLVTA